MRDPGAQTQEELLSPDELRALGEIDIRPSFLYEARLGLTYWILVALLIGMAALLSGYALIHPGDFIARFSPSGVIDIDQAHSLAQARGLIGLSLISLFLISHLFRTGTRWIIGAAFLWVFANGVVDAYKYFALGIYADSLEGLLFMATRPLFLLILGYMFFRLNRVRDTEYR